MQNIQMNLQILMIHTSIVPSAEFLITLGRKHRQNYLLNEPLTKSNCFWQNKSDLTSWQILQINPEKGEGVKIF